MRYACAVLLAMLSPCAASSQSLSAVEVVDAFHRALSERDSIAAVTHLVPDVMIFESGGAERSRDEYAGHHLGADMAFAAATERTVTDRTHHDLGDVAVVLSQVRTTGRFRDRDIDSRGSETMVLGKMPDGWRIVHIHWSSRR